MESDETKQILSFLAETLQQTKDFTIEQAPDVLQQYIGYSIFQFLAGVFCLLFLSIVCICLSKPLLKKHREEKEKKSKIDYYYYDDSYMMGFVVLLILSIALFMTSIMLSIQAISIYLYPKAYLLKSVL